MRTAIRFVLGAFFGVALLVAGLAMGGILDYKNLFGTEKVDRSQPVLLKSIQDISEFHGAVGNFEVVVDYGDDVKWVPGFIAGKRSLFVAAGTVNGFVDFSGMTDGDLTVSVDGTSAQVRLPRGQLTTPNLDHDRTYLFSQERGIVNRLGDALSTQDQQELYQLAEQKMLAAAEESELRVRAEESARTMLTGMFEALDISATITVAES